MAIMTFGHVLNNSMLWAATERAGLRVSKMEILISKQYRVTFTTRFENWAAHVRQRGMLLFIEYFPKHV